MHPLDKRGNKTYETKACQKASATFLKDACIVDRKAFASAMDEIDIAYPPKK